MNWRLSDIPDQTGRIAIVTGGVRPQLMAATCPSVQEGEIYGPRWGLRATPVSMSSAIARFDTRPTEQLWDVSQQIIGVTFPV